MNKNKKDRIKMKRVLRLISNIMVNKGIDITHDWEEGEDWEEGQKNKLKNFLKKEGFLDSRELLFECDEYILFVNVPDNSTNIVFDKLIDKINSMNLNSKFYIIFICNCIEKRIYCEQLFNSIYKVKIREQIEKKYKKTISFEEMYIVDCDYLGKDIVLNEINRYEINHMPKLEDPQSNNKHMGLNGYVMNISLFQIIQIYNMIGDTLFKNNVRYGIKDELGVDAAINETLSKNPEDFWYKNNGITIVVNRKEFKLDCINKIVLQKDVEDSLQFSVVNGAQTIIAAAKWLFEDQKERLDKIKKAMILVRIIHVQEDTKKISEISVALNRQKPIKKEDIAYTNTFVQTLTQYLLNHKNELGSHYFYLVKRGEKENDIDQINLTEFARLRLACIGQPGKARSSSANRLLSSKNIKGEDKFVLEDVFLNSICNKEDAYISEQFKKHYNAISFAHRLQMRYKIYSKDVANKYSLKSDEKIILKNGKWYFIAFYIYILNGDSYDFSEFEEQDFDVIQNLYVFCNGFCQFANEKN